MLQQAYFVGLEYSCSHSTVWDDAISYDLTAPHDSILS